MEELMSSLEAHQNWKQLLRSACRQNGLNAILAGDLTILKMKALYERFCKTQKKKSFRYEISNEKLKYSWIQNELRAFSWILLVISALFDVKITDFVFFALTKAEKEWELLESIFKHKERDFIKYEVRRILSQKIKKTVSWTTEEEKLLTQLIITNLDLLNQKQHQVKWNLIARKLFISSDEQYFRTAKHCRQRWSNHLDPHKKQYEFLLLSGEWTPEQDLKILQMVELKGKKWSKIAFELENSRTQHMVKNRYNSMLIKQQKLGSKHKKQEDLIKEIKETIVNESYSKKQGSPITGKSTPEPTQKIMEVHRTQTAIAQQIEEEQKPEKEQRKIRVLKSNSMENESLSGMPLDPALRDIIKQGPNISNRFELHQLQQIYSPFCIPGYSPGTITPTYISPPPSVPFFMNNFAQNCNNFNVYLNTFSSNPNNQAPRHSQ